MTPMFRKCALFVLIVILVGAVAFGVWYRWATGVVIASAKWHAPTFDHYVKIRRIPSGAFPPFGTSHEGHGYIYRYELWIAPHFAFTCHSDLIDWSPGRPEPHFTFDWQEPQVCRIYSDGQFIGMFKDAQWTCQ
ncbi:hypothetical protein ACXR0O_25110 [Verrucomicrobiota bacterium sgz303538]